MSALPCRTQSRGVQPHPGQQTFGETYTVDLHYQPKCLKWTDVIPKKQHFEGPIADLPVKGCPKDAVVIIAINKHWVGDSLLSLDPINHTLVWREEGYRHSLYASCQTTTLRAEVQESEHLELHCGDIS